MTPALRTALPLVLVLSLCPALPSGTEGVALAEGSRQMRRLSQVDLIQNGVPARCGRYPYMVSLRNSGDVHKCGGILVHHRWVLTAAHCVDPNDPSSLGTTPRIVIGACHQGDTMNENGKVEITIAKKTHIHYKWTGSGTGGYDIALLKLKDKSKHIPGNLPTKAHTLEPGKRLVALGWGDGQDDVLEQAATFQVVKNSVCHSEEVWGDIILGSMVCAYSPEGQDVCSGDSGGPLLEAFKPDGNLSAGRPDLDIVIGITSFGEEDCSMAEKPSVFTRLSSFRDWVDDVIAGKPQPSPSPIPAVPPTTAVPSPVPPATLPAQPEVRPAPPPVSLPASPPVKPPAQDPAEPPIGPPIEEPVEPAASSAPEPTPPSPKDDVEELNQALFDLASRAETDTTESEVEDLLSRGADPSACCYTIVALRDTFPGCAVLHATTASNNSIVASALVNAGADMAARCTEGRTPLHWAPNFNATKIATILVVNGASLEARNDQRDTPLHEAARNRANAIAELLIEAGAEVDARRNLRRTPLHVAAAEDAVVIARMLLEAGADFDAESTNGLTPLHVAAATGHLEIAEMLVAAGADTSAEDEDGNTPADLICTESFSCGFSIENALMDLLG